MACSYCLGTPTKDYPGDSVERVLEVHKTHVDCEVKLP